MTRPTIRLRLLGTAVAAALMLGVSACSAHPGVAARLSFTAPDGVRYSVTVPEVAVQDALTELTPAGVTPQETIRAIIDEPVVSPVLAEHGITVSDEQAATLLSEQLGIEDPSEGSLAVGRYILLTQAINQLPPQDYDALNADFETVSSSFVSELSPRYSSGHKWVLMRPDTDTIQLG